MAAIHELLKQVQDPALRAELEKEIRILSTNKKFGLVFEEHKPECTPLYDVPVRRGATVARNLPGKLDETYNVIKIEGETAVCCKQADKTVVEEIPLDDLIAVARFGDPIYPYLQPIDSVCNAPESDLWHTLIEADNYHALQLLEYLYAGKVDCIYIDPPYNTGAKDWKYNNDYVDSADNYRHSKWLSMMKKRLKLAKKLLNPADSVLIVTIDEKEYLHLGCLLEEMFHEAHIQMVSIVINPNGVARDHEMYRLEEYAFFVYVGEAKPSLLEDPLFTSDVNQKKGKMGEVGEDNHSHRTDVRWERLMRGGQGSRRSDSPGCFYPIFIDPIKKKIVEVGDVLPLGVSRHTVPNKDGLVTIWPIARGTGEEKRWQMTPQNLRKLVAEGFARVGAYDRNNDRWSLLYLGSNQRNRIIRGELILTGYDENGVAIVEDTGEKITLRAAKTIWNRQSHNAGEYGSRLIKSIIPGRAFAFPKSLYAVEDCLRCIVKDKTDALIVDFFAGSGTTLHAVNLLNAEDGGHRRCILVTNNEVSADEATALKKKGYRPGDPEWEALGIARYVTWPRTVCSIEGHDVNGAPLRGNYLGSDIPMADGFEANCEYFKLGFLDKDRVSLGMQFREILPLLWLKSGAKGKRPEIEGEEIPEMLILPENGFAVLTEETMFSVFAKQLAETDGVDTVFFVTNSETAFRDMSENVDTQNTYQLYRDYLENFMIGARRALG